jgi:hypothetical protein
MTFFIPNHLQSSTRIDLKARKLVTRRANKLNEAVARQSTSVATTEELREKGSTKFEVTPYGGLRAGTWFKSIPSMLAILQVDVSTVPKAQRRERREAEFETNQA